MVSKLKMAQSKVQQQKTSKANMLKKFGGKFKRAFSRKKREESLVQGADDLCVQDSQLQSTALRDLVARGTEQLPTENEPESARPDVDFQAENTHDTGNTSEELTPPPSPNPAISTSGSTSPEAATEILVPDTVDYLPSTPQHIIEPSASALTDRSKLVRSQSSPPLPSSPTTGASSETLNNTPESSPRSLTTFTQLLNKNSEASKKSHDAQLDHLESEEADRNNTEWLAILNWAQHIHQAQLTNLAIEHKEDVQLLKQDRSTVRRKLEMKGRELKAMKREIEELRGGHQAHMMELKREHDEVVEELKQDRSAVRLKLEMKSREVRALKKEMQELKKPTEEETKGQKDTQLAANAHSSNMTSGSESVDEDPSGGVILNQEEGSLTEETEKLCGESPCDPEDEEDFTPRYTREEKGKFKEVSGEETLQEQRENQCVMKQRLLDDSSPDFSKTCTAGANATQITPIGEVKAVTTPPASAGFFSNDNNNDDGDLTAQLHHLHHQNRSLTTTLSHTRRLLADASSATASLTAEITHLRASDHFAQLQVGHLHALNAAYRTAVEEEDINPARTAHFDDLLTRKDEAFRELEERAADCAKQLSEERKERAVDGVYHLRLVAGLEKELAHRLNMTSALVEGKEELKTQNDSVGDLYKAKIYPDDALKTILRNYDILKTDHTRLENIIKERECYVLDAEKSLADLNAETLRQTHAIEQERLTHRQNVQSLNGLTLTNNQLTASLEVATQTREEREAELVAQLNSQRTLLEQLQTCGVDHVLRQHCEAQNGHIAHLSAEIERVNGTAEFWKVRALERDGGFCPMWQFGSINDLGAEEVRWRLLEAERRNGVLEREVEGLRRRRRGEGEGMGDGEKDRAVREGRSWLDV